MPTMLDPRFPSETEALEDLLTIVTFLKSRSVRLDIEFQRLLDQASLRTCYLLVNRPDLTPERQRQLLSLQLSLSHRLRQPLHGGPLHPHG